MAFAFVCSCGWAGKPRTRPGHEPLCARCGRSVETGTCCVPGCLRGRHLWKNGEASAMCHAHARDTLERGE